MSLSEAPPVKITLSTSQDISDEVLGGAVSFCKETGYKQNIIMLTFLWSGFLLSSRSQLDEHGLVEDVLNCYIRSLSNLFQKLRDDATLKKQISEMLQHYWNNLNHDFTDLKTTDEVSAFLQIANKLNSQDDASSTYLLTKDPVKPFSQVSSALHSSIYRILHQIDNGMGTQYRGIVQYPFLHQQPSTSRPAAHPQAQTVSRPVGPQAQSNDSIPWGKIIGWGLAIIVILALLVNAIVSDDTPTPTIPQEPTLAAVQEPRSGTVLLGSEDLNGSELTITASGGSSCVVKLKTASGTTRLSFYVRAGDTITVGVPAEYLYVYFASGDTWYGEKHLFGKNTSYGMDDELLDFTQYTWEYTLYPVSNGNFSETPIDPEDF